MQITFLFMERDRSFPQVVVKLQFHFDMIQIGLEKTNYSKVFRNEMMLLEHSNKINKSSRW